MAEATTTIDSYKECSVVWDGALNEIVYVWGGTIIEIAYGGMHTERGSDVGAWLYEIERAADSDEADVRVFVLDHPHSPDLDECSCAQYATSHQPDYVFGIAAYDD